MKKIIIFLFLLAVIKTHAQEVIVMDAHIKEISFEDTSEYKFVYFDTDSVWFITQPQKELLSLPSNLGEYAIFTDTNLYYKSNCIAFFQFKLYLDYVDFYLIDFYQKYDFEPNKDGGIIETSHDNGETWQNLIFDQHIMDYSMGHLLYDIEDTIEALDNQPGFTGIFLNGGDFGVQWQNYSMAGDTILLRFTFASDSIDAGNEGWLLDYFRFTGGLVPIDNFLATSKLIVVPNPAQDYLTIKRHNETLIQVNIFSFTGELLYSGKHNGTESIDISFLKQGMYFIRCRNISGNIQTFKLIKK